MLFFGFSAKADHCTAKNRRNFLKMLTSFELRRITLLCNYIIHLFTPVRNTISDSDYDKTEISQIKLINSVGCGTIDSEKT